MEDWCDMCYIDSEGLDVYKPLTNHSTDEPAPPKRIISLMVIYVSIALATCVKSTYQIEDWIWVIPFIHIMCIFFVACSHRWIIRVFIVVGEAVTLWLSLHYQLAPLWNVFNGLGVGSIIVNEIWLYYLKQTNGSRR